MTQRLSLGAKASLRKTFTIEEVQQFSKLSLDANPLHLDEDYARETPFGRRIVHGMLAASLFSGLLGQELPGPGTIYLGQELRFTGPVFLDEEVTATVEITAIREDKPIVTLRTWCRNQTGDILIDGTATVLTS
ncbi:MaoC family dehydratase [bacterium]|nr:MaoC family dehydratase [bacterium]